MISRLTARDILEKHNKDALLVALWIGLPLGWTLVAICAVVYLTHGIQDATAPSPVFFVCAFVIALLSLTIAQRSVMRELRHRKDETSRFLPSLGKVALLVFIGFVFFCGILFASILGLSRMTELDSEQVLMAAARISVAFLMLGFIILALRWVHSVRGSGNSPGEDSH